MVRRGRGGCLGGWLGSWDLDLDLELGVLAFLRLVGMRGRGTVVEGEMEVVLLVLEAEASEDLHWEEGLA